MRQWRWIRDIINVINHIIYHWINVANAKMKRFRNLLIQSKEKAKTTKNRFYFFEVENQQLLNILKIERIKIKIEFNDEMMRNRATTTTMKKKNEKKKVKEIWKWWKCRDDDEKWVRDDVFLKSSDDDDREKITRRALFQKKSLNH